MTEQPVAPQTGDQPTAGPPFGEPSPRDRWLASVCYLSIFVFIPFLTRNKSTFLQRHCQQGFALFFAEMVVWILLLILEATIGLIPVLGLVFTVLTHLAAFLLFLALSVIGFIKALSGETWRIPLLDELAGRVPVQ